VVYCLENALQDIRDGRNPMTDSKDELMQEARQRMFAESIKDSQEHERRVYTTQNWILATLVAINGAPVLGMLNGNDAKPFLVAGGLFVTGVVLAVISGFVCAKHADILAAVHFLRGVFRGAKWPEQYEKRYAKLEKSRVRHETVSLFLNVGSLSFFVAGVVVSGYTAAMASRVPEVSVSIRI
jgi:hypothetical protein